MPVVNNMLIATGYLLTFTFTAKEIVQTAENYSTGDSATASSTHRCHKSKNMMNGLSCSYLK